MHTDEIRYHLPVSCVGVSGSITHTYDTILKNTESKPQATVTLQTVAAPYLLITKIQSGL